MADILQTTFKNAFPSIKVILNLAEICSLTMVQ